MKREEIKNENLLNTLSFLMRDERDTNAGYYCTFAKIMDMVLAVYGNEHLWKRGKQRGSVSGISFWIDSFLNLLTENEDIFDEVIELKSDDEAVLIDENNGKAYFFRISVAEANGEVVVKLYVKTLLTGMTSMYKTAVKSTDTVIAYNRQLNKVSKNSDLIYKY